MTITFFPKGFCDDSVADLRDAQDRVAEAFSI
jgi:hypothetical protein